MRVALLELVQRSVDDELPELLGFGVALQVGGEGWSVLLLGEPLQRLGDAAAGVRVAEQGRGDAGAQVLLEPLLQGRPEGQQPGVPLPLLGHTLPTPVVELVADVERQLQVLVGCRAARAPTRQGVRAGWAREGGVGSVPISRSLTGPRAGGSRIVYLLSVVSCSTTACVGRTAADSRPRSGGGLRGRPVPSTGDRVGSSCSDDRVHGPVPPPAPGSPDDGVCLPPARTGRGEHAAAVHARRAHLAEGLSRNLADLVAAVAQFLQHGLGRSPARPPGRADATGVA